ncbi:MAG: cytochrome P450 [Phormidesmis sp.]
MTQTTAQDIFELDGPSGNTVLGNLGELGENPLAFLTKCDRDYGDIVPLRLGPTPACLITHPDLIKEVLKNRTAFIKSRGFRALNRLLGNGLLTNEGDSWFRQRRLMQPVFHRKRIEGYGSIMVDYTEKMLNDWQSEGQPEAPRDIHADMMRLTLNIVMKALFNQDVSTGEAETVAHALDVAMEWFDSKRRQNFFIVEWFPRPENIRYRNAIKAMDNSIYDIIQQRRESGEDPGDLLSMLMAARDEDDGSGMSDQQLRDEIATLMLAGHETTANTLSWTWMLLAQHPEVEANLHKELQQVLEGRSPTTEDLQKLPYANAIIKESMRMYPPVSVLGREATTDVVVGDYLIPKNCVVIISQWVMHHSPNYFDNAQRFSPERWLEKPGEQPLEKRLPQGVYFPFGDGPRICIGKGFALMEAVLILATIAQRYQFVLEPGHTITPQSSITLRPEHGIQATLKAR